MPNSHKYYILALDGRTPVPTDFQTWVNWGCGKPTSTMIVARTQLPEGPLISTVFIGFNENLNSTAPLLFETTVFADGGYKSYKSPTWEKAEEKHEQIVTTYSNIIDNQNTTK